MKISLEQASEILSRSEQEVLFIANNEKRIPIKIVMDNDMIRHDDGTVSFTEGNSVPEWWLELEDVLAFKKEMDEGLVGEVERLLES
jgi:hypothetical protein